MLSPFLQYFFDFFGCFFLSPDSYDFQDPVMNIQINQVVFLHKRNRAPSLRFRAAMSDNRPG